MDVRVLESVHAVALTAADICCELIRDKADARLGLAAGATPQGLYAELIERHRRAEVRFARVETFDLDEYRGIGPDHPRSFHRAIRAALLDSLDVDPDRVHMPRGDAADPVAEAQAYEASIVRGGGIDLQILGIGGNGHIGFNEPGSSFRSRTRVVRLSPETLRDNRLGPPDFEEPVEAITMGIGTILEARALLVLATGAAKAGAVAAALEGPLTPQCPASALRLHPNATLLLDPEAAAKLRGTA